MELDEIGSSLSQAIGTIAAATNSGLKTLKTLFFDMISLVIGCVFEW
jgi:hypothetical protein